MAQWIALLTLEDGGCSLTFAKVTNPNIIKGGNYITIYYSSTELEQLHRQSEPKIGIQLWKLSKLASSTLG